jgi:hypothetical protein
MIAASNLLGIFTLEASAAHFAPSLLALSMFLGDRVLT